MQSIPFMAAVLCIAAAPAFAAQGIKEVARDFVEERLSDVVASPVLLDAIRAQNADHASLSQADIDALDQRWRADDASLIEATLSNELSTYLAQVVDENDGAFAEIFVMDNKGLNVGQSAKTSDYWQGDEAKWQETYSVGPGAYHVSDVEEDESTQTFLVQVSFSIVDGGEVVGAMTVGVDAEFLE